MGIMIHSLVIGLTLAIASGADFSTSAPLTLSPVSQVSQLTNNHRPASLVTAIVFHNLFEGLSLGIRIAGLPAAPSPSPSQLPPSSDTTASLPSNPEDGTPQSERRQRRGVSWLKPTLAVLFAVTTPVGIVIGLVAFERGGSGAGAGGNSGTF